METVKQVLKAGVERVILSTAAVEDPQLIQEACQKHGESVIISIDAHEGYIATRGWRMETGLEAVGFATSILQFGVKRLIYTDIGRDGTLTEPNFTAIAELAEAVRLPLIAAGGVSSLTHLKILKSLGAEGVIIGKALYSGDINLKQALATAG